MKMIDNPGKVLRRAWSMWLAYVAVLFAALDATQTQILEVLPLLQDRLPENVFAGLSLIATVFIPVARVIDQGIKAADAAAEQSKT